MQFPGMSTDPVRLRLEVTWWPPSDDFSMSRQLWTRPARTLSWELEDMATTASPIRLVDLANRWRLSSAEALTFFQALVEAQADPFPGL